VAAENFVLSVKTLPETASNNDWARWHYYLGRLEAIKGFGMDNFKDALKHFEISLRKAPQIGAVGFKQEVSKWVVLVKLLIGEIPERTLFRTKELEEVLTPNLRLTQGNNKKNYRILIKF
jgi:26S proteasome regulatory subunit N3